MPRNTSRRLVIDASVAQASGEAGDTAQRCRRFLEEVRSICHRIVLTPEVEEEWKRHQTRYARRWLRSMVARKKLVSVGGQVDATLQQGVAETARTHREEEALRKDLHLIEAALATDQTVVSLDEEARGLFAEAAKSVGQLRNIVWVNPDRLDEEPIEWLGQGAKAERHRRLGYGARSL